MSTFDRHERVNVLLAELAAEFIRSEANTDPLITVTRTTTSNDYGQSTVYFTTIPDSREADALAFLRRHGGMFREFVKKKKTNLKTIPRFDFAIDAGERHRQHIDRIASELKAAQNSSETNEAQGGESDFIDER